MKPFELLLPHAIVARVGKLDAVRVGVVGQKAQINADRRAVRLVDDLAGSLDSKLAIVAVRTAHDPHSLDLARGKGFDPLLLIANKPQPSDPAAIREGDMPPVRLQLPSGLLVLDAPIVMLELRVALRALLVVLAVLIEALDGQPGT